MRSDNAERRGPRVAVLACLVTFMSLASCVTDAQSRNRPDSATTDRTAPDGSVHSGFLLDYSQLRPSPLHADTLYEQSLRLRDYSAFIVDPVEVDPSAGLDTRHANELAASLRDEARGALSADYRVVDAPGPGVARVRACLTNVCRSRRVGDAIQVGGAGVEVEVVDSVTGMRLGAAVERDVAEAFVDGGGARETSDPYLDARLVFRHWAARFTRWMGKAEALATHE